MLVFKASMIIALSKVTPEQMEIFLAMPCWIKLLTFPNITLSSRLYGVEDRKSSLTHCFNEAIIFRGHVIC